MTAALLAFTAITIAAGVTAWWWGRLAEHIFNNDNDDNDDRSIR